jgi:hypothetical protein
MLYLERKVIPPLNRFVRVLWHARVPQPVHRRERILPSGFAQVILNLSRDFLLNCPDGQPEQRTEPSLIVGQRSTYEMVDTSDLADLIGMVLAPAALPALARDRADLFSNRTVGLAQVWGKDERVLRERLRAISSPQERLLRLENFLLVDVLPRLEKARFPTHPAVEFALHEFEQYRVGTVADVARKTGWSEL